MTDAPSPYQVPQSGMSAPPPPEAFPESRSPVPKVFGIINIVYACIGGIWALFSLGIVLLMKSLVVNNSGEAGPALAAYDKLLVYTYVDAALKALLAGVLLAAGVGLLRKRMWAQKATVFWAVVRMVTAVLMVVLTLGPSREFQEVANQGQRGQQAEFQQMAQGFGAVFGVIFVCIYPVLCLVFMSKKSVKDALS